MTFAQAPAQVVERLDVEAFAPGTRNHVWVELVQDGLGRPIRLPCIVVRGAKPGPTFGITAATHGNELNGVAVIHRLCAKADPRHIRGTLVCVVVVNVPGLLMHQREFLGGEDLNDIFPGSAAGSEALLYVHRYMERVAHCFDYLVDLHTASFGRVNSLYVRSDMTNEMSARMSYLQRPQIIVHKPPADGTFRGAMMERGIPAITVEIGDPQRFQSGYIRSCLTGLRSVLQEVGVIPKRQTTKRPLPPPLPEPVVCSRSRWIRTQHGGLLEVLPQVTQHVEEGELLARVRNSFGEVVAEYHAPNAGVIIGHSINPVTQSGGRIVHLGVPTQKGDPVFYRPTL